MKTFGERVSTLRNNKGLSQSELAGRLNIAKSTLAMYETDKREPSFEVVQRIADFFNVTTDYLITGETSIKSEDHSVPHEEREFLKWVKEQVSDSFFYDWDKDPDERKSDYIKGLRLIYELEKDRKPGQKQGE